MATKTAKVATMSLVGPSLFRALGDLTRLRLITALSALGDLCVCEMVYGTQVPQYRVSKHLAILAKAELVNAAHRGTWVRYHATEALPVELRACLSALAAQEPYASDIERIRDRMLLRDEKGLCAVGFAPENEIDDLITTAKTRKGCCS